MNYPKISIVTPSFNQGKYLEQTILSVIGQNYPNLEYIIIDGGSSDNSVEIIKKYEKYLRYWVSEKDEGQSGAINKGLKRITGNIFNWLNSDDYYEKDALFKIADAYSKNPDKKIFCFRMNHLKGKRKTVFEKQNNPDNKLQCFCDPVISQPSVFYTTPAIQNIAGINIHLHYSMDYEVWLKLLFLYSEKCIHISHEPIASFRIHPEAKTHMASGNFVNDIANILFSLCEKAGLKGYCKLMHNIFPVNSKYKFNIPLEIVDAELIERMVIYFLLKWKNTVYSQNDFFAVKMILEKLNYKKFDLSAQEKYWLKVMQKNGRSSSWPTFRIKRKIRHLFSEYL